MEPIHIIGAGVSGLGAAHYLAAAGLPSIVYEAESHYGGRAACVSHDGHRFEVGGKNFSTAWPRFTALLTEFNLSEFEPQHTGFHIVLNNRLVALDKSRTLSGDLRLASVLGVKGALQFRAFLNQARANAGELNYTSGLIEEIEHKLDYTTIDRHFTKRLVDGPLRLFSIIMGAAEPSELYPSLLTLFASGFGKGSHKAIQGSIGRFHDNLAKGKSISFGTTVNRIHIENGQVAGLDVTSNGVKRTIPAKHVISAVPVHILKSLVNLPAYARVAADSIIYRPLVLINAVYDAPIFRDDIHSIMFQPGEPVGHCSANRLSRPNHVRFTLSGKASRNHLDAPDGDLIQIAEAALSKYLPIRANRRSAHVARHNGGICGYCAYFTKVKRDLLRGVASIGGLHVAGDYLEGHTMEGCLTSAELAVEQVLRRKPLSLVDGEDQRALAITA